jgi:hypothetical protein
LKLALVFLGLCWSAICYGQKDDRTELIRIFREASVVANEFPDLLASLNRLPDEAFTTPEKLAQAILDVHKPYPDSHFSVSIEDAYYRLSEPNMYKVNQPHLSKDQRKFLKANGQLNRCHSKLCFVLQSQHEPEALIADAHAHHLPISLVPKPPIASDQFDYSLDGQIVAIRIPMMTPPADEHFKLIKLLKRRNLYTGVMLDLRGNPGGDDWFMYNLAQALRPNSFIINQSYRYRWVRSIAAQEGFVLRLRKLVQTYPEYEPVLRKHEEILADMRSSGFRRTIEERDMSVDLVADSHFAPPRISIIVDKSCASACELVVGAFISDPNVVVIGQPTRGRFKYGNGGLFQLPISGIELSLPSFGNFLSSREGKEFFGFIPDIVALSNDEQDSLAYAWASHEKIFVTLK